MDTQLRSFDDLLDLVDQGLEKVTPGQWRLGHVATEGDVAFMNIIASAWPLFRNRMGALEAQVMRLQQNQSMIARRLDDAETRAFLQGFMTDSGNGL